MTELSFNLQQQPTDNLQQMQRLMMLPQMQQAIRFLQMPVQEVSAAIEEQVELNPLLTYECEEEVNEDTEEEELDEEENDIPPEQELAFTDNDFAILQQIDDEFRNQLFEDHPKHDPQYQLYAEQSITGQPSLFEFLMQQANETFDQSDDLKMSELLIGNLTSAGYLTIPLKDIAKGYSYTTHELQKVLVVIQTFEPFGVGATSLQECLSIQLRCQGKQDTLAAKIIDNFYDDLLHNRIPEIQKGLHCTMESITEAIGRHIMHLDLHPGNAYNKQITQTLVPDVALKQEGETLQVIVNEDFPSLHVNKYYLRMLDDPSITKETKTFIQQKLIATKWLLKNIHQRSSMLERLALYLAKEQSEFFMNPNGKLLPLTMAMAATELEVHESTVARTIMNKYIDSPRGLLPLRSFFSVAYTTDSEGNIAGNAVRSMLQEIIHKEDCHKPLSDAALVLRLKEQGVTCARRTVAKYRSELNLGNAQQRRKY